MKLTSEQLKLAQGCATAEELVSKAAGAGKELSLEQAQKLIDAVSMVELNEDDLGVVSGGCGGNSSTEHICADCKVSSKNTPLFVRDKEDNQWYCPDCANKRHPGSVR